MYSHLPSIRSLDDLVTILGVPKGTLTSYVFNADQYYKRFRIRKRSRHGYRIIEAPSQELKGLQRWILMFILREIPVAKQCTNGRPNDSILKNAQSHRSQGFVFNADIEDFFPSITVRRVAGLYKHLSYPSDVAFALGRLTTCQGKLPQGAPTSPDTANLICRQLDKRISRLCEARDWVYTRYCDDISISGSGGFGCAHETLNRIVSDEGFRLNERKTRILRRNTRQTVTGLVVNEAPNVDKSRRKAWRAIFHQALLEPDKFVHRVDELSGYIGLLTMVRPADPALDRYHNVLRKVKTASSPNTGR